MPLIIPDSFSHIEDSATTLDLDSIVNSDPIITVGSRRYDIIYTSVYYNAPHLYALEYNGNEKALARLRKILALYPDTDETTAIFITIHKEPIDEGSVKEYAEKIGSDYWNSYSEGEEMDEHTIHFHLLEGKIPENYGSLEASDSEEWIPPHELIAQLSESILSWI